ncbi:hypothetical protein ACPRNU_21775 [Chromobacterium vaccinii]|uniref:hypothetical protein n=1 Tax=Chromobacterium vaccinii TaxID=1108595 RepID=UPI003C71B1B9
MLAADQLEWALALAAEAARQVSRAVLDAVLENGEACWQHSRWLVTLDYERHNRQKHPLGRMMGLNSAVSTLDGLAELIAVPDGMPHRVGEAGRGLPFAPGRADEPASRRCMMCRVRHPKGATHRWATHRLVPRLRRAAPFVFHTFKC